MGTPTASTQVFSIPPEELQVDLRLLERILGYDRTPVPEPVSSFLHETVGTVTGDVDSQCALRILPPGSCAFRKRSISVDGIEFQTEPIVAKQLRASESLALFVCTIGPRLERRARRLMDEGRTLEGFLLDQIASEIVELAADWTERKLSAIMLPMGWKTTNRYSPGYCRWSVGEQHKLFSFFPKTVCGIELTQSALMVPIKSVSGVIGVGPRVKRQAYECSVCDMTDCYRRRE